MQMLVADVAPAASRVETPPSEIGVVYTLARRRWPGVNLSYERFVGYLLETGAGPGMLAEHAPDMYLCAACRDGQTAAYRALEAAYFPVLLAILGRLMGERSSAEEVLQEVRTRLFVGPSPRIASYRGRGCLAGWLRSVAVHAAQDHLRCASVQRGWLRKLARAQGVSHASPRQIGAEDEIFHRQRAHACVQAWNDAIRALDAQERQLLHHHFVSGLSIDVLSSLYQVHRATVARRIRRAADRVRKRVREALNRQHVDVSPRDLDVLALRACDELEVALPFDPPYAA